MSTREKVRRRLRAGLEPLDHEIKKVMERYARGELDLREYVNLRCSLELEKEKKVLENLRRMSSRGGSYSPKRGTRPR